MPLHGVSEASSRHPPRDGTVVHTVDIWDVWKFFYNFRGRSAWRFYVKQHIDIDSIPYLHVCVNTYNVLVMEERAVLAI